MDGALGCRRCKPERRASASDSREKRWQSARNPYWKGGKKRGMRVGTALEPRKIGKVFHGDACHGNVERARYTEKHGFDPAAWCLSLSYSRRMEVMTMTVWGLLRW